MKKAYLFGSFARNEKKYHDIDVAIEPPNAHFSLFDLVGMQQELEAQLHQKVDLLTIKSISPYVFPYIKKDMVPIL